MHVIYICSDSERHSHLNHRHHHPQRHCIILVSSRLDFLRGAAAVCRAAGERLEMVEVEVAPPAAKEARVRIICTSLCHTDLTFWRLPGPEFPKIFGHEAVGVVEAVGDGVQEFAVGDTVVPTFSAECGGCADCLSERSNICSGLPFRPGMPRDGTTRFAVAGTGEPVHNFLSVSSFAEYTVVDVAHLAKLRRPVPPEIACLLSCGISTGVGAAWKVADVKAGSTVAIFGLGAVGLAVAEGCRVRGAAKIIGVDLNPSKFDIGKKFGITDFVNPKEIGKRPLSEVVKERAGGGGADYCFECIGLSSLMNEAFLSTRPGWGKVIVLGVDPKDSPMSIPSFELLRGRTVAGSLFGGIKHKADIPMLSECYLNKELQLDGFITHQVGFGDINTAFDLLEQGKSLRCIIWMGR